MKVYAQTSIRYCLSRCWAKSSNLSLILLEVGEILQQRLYPAGTKKHEHVVIHVLQIRQVAGHGAVEHAFAKADIRFHQQINHLLLVNIRNWQQVLLVLVFADNIHQICKLLPSVKYFTLSVSHVVLHVVCRRLRNAEIFHAIRHGYPHFLTHSKEVIHGISASQNNGRVLQNANLFLPELLGMNRLYVNKWSEIDLELVLLS